MEREFRMILPKFDNEGHRISTDVIKRFAVAMANRFGGITVLPTTLGCYAIHRDGGLQCDENAVLESVRTDATQDQLQGDQDFMVGLAGQAARELGQESVFEQQETDTRTTFVPGQLRPAVPVGLREGDIFKRIIG